jgi:hypothetical protein
LPLNVLELPTACRHTHMLHRCMPPEDTNALQDIVARATEELIRVESELEVAAEERRTATTEAARQQAVAHAVAVFGKIEAARKRLSDAKRSLAKAQGDTFRDDETTRTI